VDINRRPAEHAELLGHGSTSGNCEARTSQGKAMAEEEEEGQRPWQAGRRGKSTKEVGRLGEKVSARDRVGGRG
jgi:hypothetical protein